MYSHTIIIIITQYVLMICLFLINILDYENSNKSGSKKSLVFGGLFTTTIMNMMIFIDSHNDFNSYYPIHTLTIRLFTIIAISLFQKRAYMLITLPIIFVTRLFYYGGTERDFIIILFVLVTAGFTRICDQKINTNIYNKWLCVTSSIAFLFILYFFINQVSILVIIEYTLLISSIIFITNMINFNISKFNHKRNAMLENVNTDLQTTCYHSDYIENHYNQLVINNIKFTVVIIDILNLNKIKKVVKFSEYNQIISQIGILINLNLSPFGNVGKLKTDQYCIIIDNDKLNLNDMIQKTCLDLENLVSPLNNIKVNVESQIIDGNLFNKNYNFFNNQSTVLLN